MSRKLTEDMHKSAEKKALQINSEVAQDHHDCAASIADAGSTHTDLTPVKV